MPRSEQSLFGTADKTTDVKNFEYGQKNPAFAQFLASSKSGGKPKLGLNVQYGVDANGNPVIIQAGDDGVAVRTKMPEGVTLSKQPIKMDAGSHFVLLDPVTRQQIGVVKKDLEGAEAEKVKGKAMGEAQVNLGGIIQKADQSIALIDQMLKHPGLSTATGLSGVLDPRNYIAGTDATNFNVMRKQLEGKAFLEAFESLKGGGQITEIEGQKGTDAIARLSTAQSEEEYRKALQDLREVLIVGQQRARAKARGEVTDMPASPTSDPSDGWQSLGGVKIRRRQ